MTYKIAPIEPSDKFIYELAKKLGYTFEEAYATYQDMLASCQDVESEPVARIVYDRRTDIDGISCHKSRPQIWKLVNNEKLLEYDYNTKLYTSPQPSKVAELEEQLKDRESDLDHEFKRAEVAEAKRAKVEADKARLVEALKSLSFECFNVIGTTAPSIHTYNRTFKLLAEMEVK